MEDTHCLATLRLEPHSRSQATNHKCPQIHLPIYGLAITRRLSLTKVTGELGAYSEEDLDARDMPLVEHLADKSCRDPGVNAGGCLGQATALTWLCSHEVDVVLPGMHGIVTFLSPLILCSNRKAGARSKCGSRCVPAPTRSRATACDPANRLTSVDGVGYASWDDGDRWVALHLTGWLLNRPICIVSAAICY